MPKFCVQCPEDDKKRARYGFINESAQCCPTHKDNNMINLSQKLCKFNENEIQCTKQAFFNIIGKKAEWCGIHKTNDMINVKVTLCIGKTEDGKRCTTRPSFNLAGEPPEWCGIHKLDGMIDVKSKLCIGKTDDGKPCPTRAIFNIPGQKAKFCAAHKTDNMVNISSKKCSHVDKDGNKCTTQATFGLKDKLAERCKTHKTKEMINVKSRLCDGKNSNGTSCMKRPTFGNEGERFRFCAQHKTEIMVDLTHPKCIAPLCDTVAQSPQYKGYCAYCYSHMFPNDPIVKNIKTKEKEVTNHVKELLKHENLIMTFDKQTGGCSRRRPDILIESFQYTIIVEVDENGHTNYDTTCENKRICQLYQDLSLRNLIIIRINPDGYVNKTGKRIKSPWKVGISGKLIIDDKKEWEKRLKVLDERILYWIKNDSGQAMKIEYLFYNGYNEKKEELDIVTIVQEPTMIDTLYVSIMEGFSVSITQEPKKCKELSINVVQEPIELTVDDYKEILKRLQSKIDKLGNGKYLNIETLRPNTKSERIVINNKYSICARKFNETNLLSFCKWLTKNKIKL